MRISTKQVFWLMLSMEIGMLVLLPIQPTIQEAKQDAWISTIIAGVGGMLITLVATKLSLLYPNKTFVEFTQDIVGKWLGKIIVLSYLAMWYLVTGVILRQSSDFIQISLFRKTPVWVLMFSILVVVIYMTYSRGIETIARCSEIFGPVILLTLIVTFGLSFGSGGVHWKRIIPMYADSGALSILKGSLFEMSLLAESIMLMLIIPFVNKPERVIPRALLGVAIPALTVVITTTLVIMTFGNLASKMWFPFVQLARYISVTNLLQNVDSLIIIIWLLSIIIKLSLHLFITAYGTAQWLGVKNWRLFVLLSATLSMAFAFSFKNAVSSSVDYPTKFWIPYVFPINLCGIPLLLLIIGFIRKPKKL